MGNKMLLYMAIYLQVTHSGDVIMETYILSSTDFK